LRAAQADKDAARWALMVAAISSSGAFAGKEEAKQALAELE